MGICKCVKKRVTSSFCFNHRVNVCEFCMVNSHPACIVQPYLQWLEDSSYKAKCSFCQLNLTNEECVRLLCYHVFHWTCLNKHYSSLPSNTTPAGYTCVDCNIPIFPSSDSPQHSPIYSILKKKLSTTEWARIGLNLPINHSNILTNKASENQIRSTKQSTNATSSIENNNPKSTNLQQIENPIQQTFDQEKNNLNSNVFIHHNNQPLMNNYELNQSIPVSVNNVNSYLNNHTVNSTDYLLANHNFSSFNSSSRKIIDSDYSSDRDRLILDIDEDKYRTRSPIDKLFRYFKFMNYKHRLNANQRFTIMITLSVLAVFFVIFILISLGRRNAANDPLLDPKFNPDLHFQDVDNFN